MLTTKENNIIITQLENLTQVKYFLERSLKKGEVKINTWGKFHLGAVLKDFTAISTKLLHKQNLVIFMLIIFSFSWSPILNATSVHYAGFCFTGNYADIPVNFKYTNLIVQDKISVQSILDKEFYQYFQKHVDFNNFKLVFGQAQDAEEISLAIALHREDIAFETISGKTKAIYNIGCTIFILDFHEMKVLQSYPLNASFIDLYDQKPSDETIKETFLDLLTTTITSKITDNQETIAIQSSNSRTMKVANVTFDDSVLPCLSFYKDNLSAYSNLIAQHVTQCFAYQLNVTMLPYCKDSMGQKMSLAFTDATVQNFTIPTASYDIDVDITKLVKKLYKETFAERVDIFGTYVNVKIYDAELDTEYWNKEVKHGATKQTAAGQEVADDFFNYNEVILATFSTEVIKTILKDKKLRKGVISKCVNY